MEASETKKTVCLLCDKVVSKSNLKRHVLTHGIESTTSTNKATKPSVTKTFEKFADFLKWKEDIESETLSSFVKNRGKSKGQNGQVYVYYDCCRSGNYKSKEDRKRALKSQQSKKIGEVCPAKMNVTITNTNTVVKYFNEHNHLHQLEHLSVPKSLRASIAGKLKEGVAPKKVLEDIRKSASSLDRLQLINKRYIHNIRRDFKIGKNNIIRLNMDLTSSEIKPVPSTSSSTNHPEVGNTTLDTTQATINNRILPSIPTENLKYTVESMLKMASGLNSRVTMEDTDYHELKKFLENGISILKKYTPDRVGPSLKQKNENQQQIFFLTRKRRKVGEDIRKRNPTFAEALSQKKRLLNDYEENIHTELDHLV